MPARYLATPNFRWEQVYAARSDSRLIAQRECMPYLKTSGLCDHRWGRNLAGGPANE